MVIKRAQISKYAGFAVLVTYHVIDEIRTGSMYVTFRVCFTAVLKQKRCLVAKQIDNTGHIQYLAFIYSDLTKKTAE